MRKLIEALQWENARLRAENFSLAAWQCEFTDGKTGLVAGEGGSTYCAMAKRVERLRTTLEEIATAKPQQIGGTGFQQGPLSLWQWAQRKARAALEGRT
jgi:hypothetical protein